jgi:hypothetical protein
MPKLMQHFKSEEAQAGYILTQKMVDILTDIIETHFADKNILGKLHLFNKAISTYVDSVVEFGQLLSSIESVSSTIDSALKVHKSNPTIDPLAN